MANASRTDRFQSRRQRPKRLFLSFAAAVVVTLSTVASGIAAEHEDVQASIGATDASQAHRYERLGEGLSNVIATASNPTAGSSDAHRYVRLGEGLTNFAAITTPSAEDSQAHRYERLGEGLMSIVAVGTPVVENSRAHRYERLGEGLREALENDVTR